MLLSPTIPGMYIVPSIALDILVFSSNCFICSGVKMGFKTYFMSFKEESEININEYYYKYKKKKY